MTTWPGHLAHQTFDDEALLESAIKQAVHDMNNERTRLIVGRLPSLCLAPS
jgi:hypothetical protein